MVIKHSDLTTKQEDSTIMAYFFGLEHDIDKTILRYIFQNNNIINRDRLYNYLCLKNHICSEQRFMQRMTSLKKFKILTEFRKYNTTFYQLDKKFLSEIKKEHKTIKTL